MKRKITMTAFAAAFTLAISIPAFAGQWNEDAAGWWYQNDDSSYCSNGWNWINGRCYYFNANGYMLSDTTTPDGYTVDASGAWTVNGVVQEQQTAQNGGTEQTGSGDSGQADVAGAVQGNSYSGVFEGPYYNDDGSISSTRLTVEVLADGSINVTGVNGTNNFRYEGPFYGEGGGEVYAIETEEMKESVIFRGYDLLICGGEEFKRVQ